MTVRDIRDAQAIERLPPDAGDREVSELEEVESRTKSPRAALLLARARAAQGEFEAALAAAERARSGLGAAAGLVLRAEVLLDSGRAGEARSTLEKAAAAEPGNIVAPGLLRVLDLAGAGMRGEADALSRFPPGSLWCPPVLSRLVLALETAVETLAAGGKSSPELHRARTTLFRPHLESEEFRPFWFEGLGLSLPFRGVKSRQRARQTGELRAALRAGNLDLAAELLAAASSGGDQKESRSEEEWTLAMEIAFTRGRFTEVPELHRRWLDAGLDREYPYPAALAAYAHLAEGKPRRAREALEHPLRAPDRPGELLHLAALVEIGEGALPRAAAFLRAAAETDDIAMATLAKEEWSFLNGVRPGAKSGAKS